MHNKGVQIQHANQLLCFSYRGDYNIKHCNFKIKSIAINLKCCNTEGIKSKPFQV
jgi:hypothetical protein